MTMTDYVAFFMKNKKAVQSAYNSSVLKEITTITKKVLISVGIVNSEHFSVIYFNTKVSG